MTESPNWFDASALGAAIKSTPLGLLVAPVIILVFLVVRAPRPSAPLPPGPRGLPILGNALQLRGYLWLALTKWAKEYGPVVHVSAFGRHIIALNTLEAVSDILDDKAAVTSDGDQRIMMGLLTKDNLLAVMPGNSVWSRRRKTLLAGLRPMGAFLEWLPRESSLLATDLLRAPNDWRQHFQLAVHSGNCGVAYGDRSLRRAPMRRWAKQAHWYLCSIVKVAKPGLYLVEMMPWLNVLPRALAPWKREADRIYNVGSGVLHEMYDEGMASPNSKSPCLLQYMEDTENETSMPTQEKVWLSGQVILGGATTQGVLSFWLLAMVLYPETQKAAWEELDAVVGREQPPRWEHCEKMPYLLATVRETLRWRPTLPCGLMHVASEDIHYKGHLIPQGSILVPNVWAINRSPDLYGKDATDFNPARFLDPDTKQLLPPLARTRGEGHVAFGFGPRACPGRQLANRVLAINIATMMWALRVAPAEGPGEARTWDPEECLDEGIIVSAPDFPCRITERFPGALKLLEKGAGDDAVGVV